MSIQYLTKKKEEKPDEPSKILFTGLDYAGKTTIIKGLQREFSKIALLKPTRGAQRRIFEFLGRDIAEWDLGGQVSYRIAYLKNPGKYFDGTEVAIYVIDIQSKSRFSEAISYFKDVVEQFKKLGISPPIYVFLHKYDPALKRNAPNELKALEAEIKEKIKSLVDYKKVYYYNTSIYDLASIIKAMSEILLNLYPKADLIEKTVFQFAEKVNSEGVVILDDNSLIVGAYYKNDEARNLLSASTPYFLALNDNLQFTEVLPGKEYDESKMVIQRFGRNFIFKQLSLREGSPPYYLVMLKQDPNILREDFDTFSNLLKELLYK
ncbi:MAG: ADP-ribosylation factor-like protein [Candidatus Hodarchaeota archaeon]